MTSHIKTPVKLPNDSVYRTTGSKELFAIYFYYVRHENDNIKVTLYYHFEYNLISSNRLIKAITEMAVNARAGDYIWPPCGNGFNAIPRRRRGYIVIMVDDKNHFLKKKSEGGAVTFYDKNDAELNHTFFDGMDLDINMAKEGEPELVPAIVFINHMNSNTHPGELGENEMECFRLELNCHNKFRGPPYENGGTNQGQPPPPPYRKLFWVIKVLQIIHKALRKLFYGSNNS